MFFSFHCLRSLVSEIYVLSLALRWREYKQSFLCNSLSEFVAMLKLRIQIEFLSVLVLISQVMGQKNSTIRKEMMRRKVCPSSDRNPISRSGAWVQTSRNLHHSGPSLADVVAEFGLKVPYEPSDCSSRSILCFGQPENEKQEMEYLFPKSPSKTIFDGIMDKIFHLQSYCQHITFKREDNRKSNTVLSDSDTIGISMEDLDKLKVF